MTANSGVASLDYANDHGSMWYDLVLTKVIQVAAIALMHRVTPGTKAFAMYVLTTEQQMLNNKIQISVERQQHEAPATIH